MDKGIHFFLVFYRDDVRGIEVLYGSRDANGKARSIVFRNRGDTVGTGNDIVPRILEAITYRGNNT